MSRRKHPHVTPHVTYGQIALRRPHSHPCGAILLTRHGDIYLLDRQLGDNQSSVGQALPIGEKVKVNCPDCRQAGRQPNYQASWAAVTELLTVQRRDPGSERHVLTLS